MPALKEIEEDVQSLQSHEYTSFRKWFYKYDNEVWDNELKNDSDGGALDFLIDEANDELARGKLKKI